MLQPTDLEKLSNEEYRGFLISTSPTCLLLVLFPGQPESFAQIPYLRNTLSYSPVLSSRNFSVSSLTLKSLFNLELICVQNEKEISSLILLCPDSHFPPIPIVNDAILTPMHLFGTFVKNQVTVGQ